MGIYGQLIFTFLVFVNFAKMSIYIFPDCKSNFKVIQLDVTKHQKKGRGAEDGNGHFTKEDKRMVDQHMKRCSVSPGLRGSRSALGDATAPTLERKGREGGLACKGAGGNFGE